METAQPDRSCQNARPHTERHENTIEKKSQSHSGFMGQRFCDKIAAVRAHACQHNDLAMATWAEHVFHIKAAYTG